MADTLYLGTGSPVPCASRVIVSPVTCAPNVISSVLFELSRLSAACVVSVYIIDRHYAVSDPDPAISDLEMLSYF